MNSLISLGFLLIARLDGYRRWCSIMTVVPSFRRMLPARSVVLSQWRTQFDHWVSVAVAFVGFGQLMTVFPTAQVVLTHRDPAEVLPSTCSLFSVTRRIHDHVDKLLLAVRKHGAVVGEVHQRSMDAQTAFADRITHVAYSDLVGRPTETVRNLCAWVEPSIRRWRAACWPG